MSCLIEVAVDLVGTSEIRRACASIANWTSSLMALAKLRLLRIAACFTSSMVCRSKRMAIGIFWPAGLRNAPDGENVVGAGFDSAPPSSRGAAVISRGHMIDERLAQVYAGGLRDLQKLKG